MKKNPITYTMAFGCCVVSLWLWNYLSGRFGFHYTIFEILGWFALLGAAFFAFGSSIILIVMSLSESRSAAALLSILLLGALVWLPFSQLNPFFLGDVYLLGVRQRISSQATPDQLRQMAAQAIVLLGNERGISGPSKPSWGKMLEVPGFSNLVDKRVLFTGPFGVVVGLGGCAVCGHTGLQVQEPVITNRYSKGGHLSIAPDIEVFYDPK